MEVPSVSHDVYEEGEEKILTMIDVLKEQTELEENANAVLGGADDKICSYSKGYVKRQPLYSCTTCNSSGSGNPAGICLACSYRCHEGHELIELYTKRNFRCDCGNSLFGNNKCSLEPQKDAVNEKNQYNQNFRGLYCTCKRPYPDPEDTVQDEMIQCVLCEDWFHKKHLQITNDKPSDNDEMICFGCMEQHSFLWNYSVLYSQKNLKDSEGSSDISNKVIDNCGDLKSLVNENNRNENEENMCYLQKKSSITGSGSLFWPEGWRRNLCKCSNCIKMYKENNVNFLLDEEDTVEYYETKNKEIAKETQYEMGLKALSSLDRVKQIEAIQGYNQMEAELMGYLQKFAENKKVVREEDIREFFGQITARKKQKIEIPYFCH